MNEYLHMCVMSTLKSIIQFVRVVSISVDEVIVIDNTSWIGIHVYTVESWERVLHLLHLSYVSESDTTNHLTNVIMSALLEEGRLICKQIALKLVSFGADRVSTFQGPKIGVSAQIWKKWASFSLGASCANHRINLVVETLSNYPMVFHLEGLF